MEGCCEGEGGCESRSIEVDFWTAELGLVVEAWSVGEVEGWQTGDLGDAREEGGTFGGFYGGVAAVGGGGCWSVGGIGQEGGA